MTRKVVITLLGDNPVEGEVRRVMHAVVEEVVTTRTVDTQTLVESRIQEPPVGRTPDLHVQEQQQTNHSAQLGSLLAVAGTA